MFIVTSCSLLTAWDIFQWKMFQKFRMLIVIEGIHIAGAFPVRNVDDLHTDRYKYKKPKSTDAVFVKLIFFFFFLEKMTGCYK